MTRYRIEALSDIGRLRGNNEDMILVNDCLIRDSSYKCEANLDDSDRFIVALADGMGGHNGGEVASEDTLESLKNVFSVLPPEMNEEEFNGFMTNWFEHVNKLIDNEGKANPFLADMGTTLTSFVYYNSHFYWLNCGDSRIYRIHEGEIEQITYDHSLANLMGETNHTNVITNCIGAGCPSSFIDITMCDEKVSNGDYFLLCSDGLSDMIEDDIILDIVMSGGGVSQLVRAANIAGGSDNVSVCLIQCLE